MTIPVHLYMSRKISMFASPETHNSCCAMMQFNRSVADNIMSIDEHFWLRLATRNDAADEEEKQKLSSLATTVMHLVEAAVAKTEEQLTGSGKIVQKIMAAGANADGTWVIPLPDENAEAMKQVCCSSSFRLLHTAPRVSCRYALGVSSHLCNGYTRA